MSNEIVDRGGPTPEQEREAMEAMVEHERSQTKTGQAALVWHHGPRHAAVLAVDGDLFVALGVDGVVECFDFDDAPEGPGLWVWEGSARWYGGGYETPHDGEWRLEGGTWRRPTEAEARRVVAGQSPFDAGAPESEVLSNQVETLSRLGAAWAKQPDLRLGQFLINAIKVKQPRLACPAVFYISDTNLAELANHFAEHGWDGGGDLTTPEPAPSESSGPVVWPLVIADVREIFPVDGQIAEDMQARHDWGQAKYGTPLQVGNGRDALVDAYQEALDLCVYLRQYLEELPKETALDEMVLAAERRTYREALQLAVRLGNRLHNRAEQKPVAPKPQGPRRVRLTESVAGTEGRHPSGTWPAGHEFEVLRGIGNVLLEVRSIEFPELADWIAGSLLVDLESPEGR